MHVDYDEWSKELEGIAVTRYDFQGDFLAIADWKGYFDKGYTPEEAILEDMANAE